MTASPSALPAARVEEAILERAAARADEWFPGVGARPQVRLRRLRERPRATLYRVEIGAGPRPRRVLAKVRRGWSGAAQEAGARPRLAPDLLPAADQTVLEFAGLTALHAMFGSGSACFGAVRPLDHLVEENTVLMDYVDAPTLRDALVRHSRLSLAGRRRGGDVLEESCRRSGAWLRAFQQKMPGEGLPARQATRDEVVDRFEAFGAYLAGRLGSDAVGDAARSGARLAADVLPDRLPLAVGHGDYAPRNVFRFEDGRLAVFDPLCRWSVPRVEDLCRFLVALRLQGSQVHTRGAAFGAELLARCEEAVLEGYGSADAFGLPQIRCFQLLITLDRWSALVSSPSRSWAGRLQKASLSLASGFLRSETRRLVGLADAAA